MGIAQGVDYFINLAALLQNRMDIGFVFVGRGSELRKLNDLVLRRSLDNVLFFDEIHPDEIPGLYSQCTIGLVALDPRHKSHNIPGKFLTYMQAGLPVLARINADNDLVRLIQENNVGRVSSQTNDRHFERLACEILDMVDADSEIKNRCRGLYINNFSPVAAVGQIVNALRDEKVWV
jgi:glycosyltransferase involved in cell wall biosynthesis